MIGNTSMHILRNNGTVNTTQMNEISNPNNGVGGVGYTQYGNDQSNMQFARIDNSTTGIYNATSADLILPAGNNTIKYARLYWGGRILTSALNTAADTLQRVKIRKGNSGNYFNVIAPASNVDFFNVTATERIYQSYVDVTAFINSNGAGTYTVANVPSTPGSVSNGGRFAGSVAAHQSDLVAGRNLKRHGGQQQPGARPHLDFSRHQHEGPLYRRRTSPLSAAV